MPKCEHITLKDSHRNIIENYSNTESRECMNYKRVKLAAR